MTKIDIISGFLGAGKTTLIKKLIKEAYQNEKIVLIENEFGEIGIDGGFLKEAGIEIKEMNSGCICCSLVGDFSSALEKVMETYAPERIIIEPSGVGKLSDVIKAVGDLHDERMQLNSFTTVVDGNKCKLYMKNFGEFFNNQVAYAKTIVISRTQMMDSQKLASVIHLLQAQNPKASLIATPWEDIDGKKILAAMEETSSLEKALLEEMDICPECHHHHEEGTCCETGHHHHHDHDHHEEGCCCGHEHHHEHSEGCGCGEHHHEHHHHHADDVFTSWGCETIHTYEEEALRDILKELSENTVYGTILRAKGMVETPDKQWLYFDLVPGEYDIRKGSAETIGKLCVIGADLKEAEIRSLFQLPAQE